MSKLRALTMPKWGIEMVEGRIAEWSIAEGERMAKGQIIALIETDKIVNDLEAEYDAQLVRRVAEAGETYPVGTLLAVLAEEPASANDVDRFVRDFRVASGSAAATMTASSDTAAQPAVALAALDSTISPAARRLATERNVDVATVRGSGRRGRITLQDIDQASKPDRPIVGGAAVCVAVTTAALDGYYASAYAKRAAARHAVDLSTVTATGPRGRISQQDVLRAAGVGSASSSRGRTVVERFSPIRKAIARQLTLSKSTIPHFYLRTDVNLNVLVASREQARRAGGTVPSLNDYLLRAAALALIESPGVNVQVHGEEIHRFADADIAVAVATDRGLITPIVRAANEKSVSEIAAAVRDLADRARSGRLRSDEYTGGTFSVSNLGMYGIDEFDAIINPPQGAILAIGAARRRPVEQGGELGLATTVRLSLSCDHRAIDGAVGAQFLATLRALLEQPDRL